MNDADCSTEARATLERLRELEALVNRSPAIVALWRVEEGWPVEFVSENVRQFGYAAEDFLSRRALWPDLVHPEDRAKAEAEIIRCLQSGVLEFTQCYRLWTKSGEVRWVEDRSLALTDPSGAVTHVQSIVLDITDRKEAERKYEASERMLHTICEAVLDAVLMMDADGNVAHWNHGAEMMFGYRRDEVMGKNVHKMLVPPEHRERAERRLREFAVSGKGRTVGQVLELSALRKDGSRFAIETSVAPIRFEDRWGAVSVIRDITERKRAEEAAAREERQLRRLLDIQERERRLLAYELHDGFVQPLTAALMTLESSLEDQKEQRAGSAAKRQANAVRLLRESIDQVRRLMEGLRPPILDQYGVVSAIENLACEVQEGGGPSVTYHRNVRFTRLAPPLETAIFRVVQEGLSNARRHSGANEVRIGLHQQGDRVRVEIEDNGVGFDPETVRAGCFGLEGLRERARLFGGSAAIDSAPGRGSRLVVEFPLVDRDAVEPTASEHPIRPPSPARPPDNATPG